MYKNVRCIEKQSPLPFPLNFKNNELAATPHLTTALTRSPKHPFPHPLEKKQILQHLAKLP
jgi:hypothetical protein